MAVLGYLFGRLPAARGVCRLPRLLRRYFGHEILLLLKGLVPVVLANIENPTPMVTAVTAMAAIVGNLSSEDRGRTAWVAAGTMLVVRLGWVGAVILVSGTVLAAANKKMENAGPVVFILAAAPLIFKSESRDIHFLWGALVGAVVLYEVLLREWVGGTRAARYLRAAAFGTLFLFLGVSAFYLVRYHYRNLGIHVKQFARGPLQMKVVALTFDDGPDPKYTPAILDILDQFNVKATFFMVGTHVSRNPELAKRVADRGHEIGSHTYTHRNLLGLPRLALLREVVKNQSVIEKATGRHPTLFRPPRGLYDNGLGSVLEREGLTLVLWSRSSVDWSEPGPEAVVRNVLTKVQNGDVILFHDSGDLVGSTGGSRLSTVEALPTIISELKRRGYAFMTITEMMVLSGLVGGN